MIGQYRTVFISAVCIFVFLCELLHAAILLDRVVAIVNKEVITWSELYKAMESEASEQVKDLKEEERKAMFKNSETAFLEKLIDMKLQIQEAKRLGFQVSEEEVKEAVGNIKKKYKMNDATMEESLKKEGLTFEEYKKRLSEQILISQFINHQIKNKIVVTDDQVKNYLDKHRGNTSEEEYKLRQIFFRKPKDDDLRKELEEKAAMIEQRLRNGEDFAALGWEYSEDPSAKIGSDLGYLRKSDMAKEFLDVLSSMKIGDISQPFWTEQGLHIIRLEDKISAKNTDEQKELIRKQLEDEAFAEKYSSYLKVLREKARIEIRL